METKNPTLKRQLSGSSERSQIWIDPYTNERVWVFNPMHIVHLTKQTKSRFVRVVEGFKHFSNRWFSHVLLLMFLILYGFLGAYIFVTLEAPIEATTKGSVNNMRERIIKELWWSSNQFSKGWWQRLAKIRLKEFERQLHESCIASQTTNSEQKVWNFWQALFFSSTIFTTIGYGHVVPKTDAGRAASIIYAFIGIPLLLMVLTDLGKLFTRGIKFVFKYCRKLYYNRQVRKMRQATKAPTQFVSQTFDAVNRKMSTVVPMRNRLFSKDEQTIKQEIAGDGAGPGAGVGGGYDEATAETMSETVPDFEVDDEFNLPISVAVLLLLLYMMAGAAVFTIWEKWTFFESFYFVYISLSTIGFGDYVPEHPAFMMCTFIYLLFGLALTSMCINVVQEKLSATFQKAKLRIGATMGLDITQLMEEELNQDNVMMPPPPQPPPNQPTNQQPAPLTTAANSNNNAKEAQPKLLKNEGIGDALREKREKKRKMSNVNTNVNKNANEINNNNNNPANTNKVDDRTTTADETGGKEAAPTASVDQRPPTKGKPKTVDFQED